MTENNADMYDEFVDLDPNMLYSKLREEILKRLDIRYQLINYTIVAFGVFMSLGFSEDAPDRIILVYLPVSLGFVFAWVDNHYRLKLITDYMRQNKSAWEVAYDYHRDSAGLISRERFGGLSIAAIFLGTQSIVVGVDFARYGSFHDLALYASFIIIITSLLILYIGYKKVNMALPEKSQSD